MPPCRFVFFGFALLGSSMPLYVSMQNQGQWTLTEVTSHGAGGSPVRVQGTLSAASFDCAQWGRVLKLPAESIHPPCRMLNPAARTEQEKRCPVDAHGPRYIGASAFAARPVRRTRMSDSGAEIEVRRLDVRGCDSGQNLQAHVFGIKRLVSVTICHNQILLPSASW